jgi:hypothetical protein
MKIRAGNFGLKMKRQAALCLGDWLVIERESTFLLRGVMDRKAALSEITCSI